MLKMSVCYEDFGAVGDGKNDDFPAIQKAHDYANEQGLPVIAKPNGTYYIGDGTISAVIMTDTNWSTARFIIDDTKVPVENREHNIFEVRSRHTPARLKATSIRKSKLMLDYLGDVLSHNAFVVAENENCKQFIRYGPNPTPGDAQTDCFILDKSGVILTPVIWDFDEVTSLTAYPIDERVLTISGGIFTTIANSAESKYTYYARGIGITRSNVEVSGIVHYVTEEQENGAPYTGFVYTQDCAYVTFRNCHFSGHKIYVTIGGANEPVEMGSYDINLFRSIGVRFENCKQENILDNTLWGIFGSNYCKDIVVDGCVLSRVDAHKGVANLTIKNSTIGWMGIKAIGHGHLLIDNVKVFCNQIVGFRPDYGSSWDGDLTIKNVEWFPASPGSITFPTLSMHEGKYLAIVSENNGGRDFGYDCSLPIKVTIENLCVMDGDLGEDYLGVSIFYVPPRMNDHLQKFDCTENHPYIFTSELTVKNASTKSGKGFSIWSEYPTNGYCKKPHEVKDGVAAKANFRIVIEGVDKLEIKIPTEIKAEYNTNHRLLPRIEARNYDELDYQPGLAPIIFKDGKK